MRNLTSVFVAGILALEFAPNAAAANHRFEISGNDFLLDGQKLVVISGEMHYPRVPRVYWRDRMRKMRAMGLNTLTTYVFWNAHEATPGKFDFSGELDIAEYVRTAQQEGLWVILRPGPYVCAEWDLGGLPSWLLRDPSVRLRENEPKFLAAASAYMNEVGKRLAPLMVTHGGPILMVQVENEYGSFGSDHAYMEAIRNMIRKAGFDGQLYTADGSSDRQLSGGTLPDLPVAINFGNSENPSQEFARLDRFRPKGPRMCGEFWAGWFDTWGESHATTPVERAAAALDWMLSRGISVSVYMIHGGTSFGFHAGADFRKAYMPDTTSYDYDSPLDEAGRPTPKFQALREVIRRYLPPGTVLPDPPASAALVEIPAFEFRESAPLGSVLGAPIRSARPVTMEELGQPHGMVLYRHKAGQAFEGPLEIDRPGDYAIVSVAGRRVGIVDRRLEAKAIPVILKPGDPLDILVDVMGHINFGPRISNDRKGIAGARLAGTPIEGWEIYGIPLDAPPAAGYSVSRQTGPAFYRAKVDLAAAGDTYLDMGKWGKGFVWVNGHNLGRYWSAGPQQALFLPAGWLHTGANEIVALDLEPDHQRTVRGLEHPVWRSPPAKP
ncbi:MAG TPA: beta-galactosidase family protein [Bryobacteraceae bacterium]|nr:beta-galactosidase family protein [Bryobacteraceae bacterium]